MIKLFQKARISKMKKKQFFAYLLYAVGEIVLIVVGILLALYLQNRNEKRKETEAVNASINMIKEELKANKKNISTFQNYHIFVRDTLLVVKVPKRKEDIKKVFSFWKGINAPRLQNAAFQTSIQSGLGRQFNSHLLKELNEIYTYQESYNEFVARSSEIFFNADFTDMRNFEKTMSSIQILMNDLSYFDYGLIKGYTTSIQKIDSIQNN